MNRWCWRKGHYRLQYLVHQKSHLWFGASENIHRRDEKKLHAFISFAGLWWYCTGRWWASCQNILVSCLVFFVCFFSLWSVLVQVFQIRFTINICLVSTWWMTMLVRCDNLHNHHPKLLYNVMFFSNLWESLMQPYTIVSEKLFFCYS